MSLFYRDDHVALHHGDATEVLAGMSAGSVDCAVTSPPYYGLRDYGEPGQIGAEPTPGQYIDAMVALFDQVARVLTPTGTLWLNLGDSYATAGSKTRSAPGAASTLAGRVPGQEIAHQCATSDRPAKNLMGIPWRVALALQDAGWLLRNAIIWHKPNAMPESVTDRLRGTYETVFLLTRGPRYYFDLDAIRQPHLTADRPIVARDYSQQPGSWAAGSGGNHRSSGPEGVGRHPDGRNPGDVWSIPTSGFSGSHFAVFPAALPRRCILAGCPAGGLVLDPFSGSGTTGWVAEQLGRRYVGIDLNADYLALSLRTRLAQPSLLEVAEPEQMPAEPAQCSDPLLA